MTRMRHLFVVRGAVRIYYQHSGGRVRRIIGNIGWMCILNKLPCLFGSAAVVV